MRNKSVMFSALLASSVILAPSGMAMAQGPDGDGDTPQPERQRRDRGSMGERWGGRMTDQIERLKEQLGLDDDQVKRLEELTTPMRDGLFEEMRRLREGGGEFNWEDMRERMRGFRDQLNETIGSVLTEDQKQKFQELLANPDRGRRGRRGDRNPERNRQRRIDDAKQALIMTPEEENVLGPMIEAVVDAQTTVRTTNDEQRREFTEFLRSGAEAEAVSTQLAEFRQQRDTAEATLATARSSLQEVLSLEQEAKLVALGILR